MGVFGLFLLGIPSITFAQHIRQPFDDFTTISFRNGRLIFLECRPPNDDGAKPFLDRYLADGVDWHTYAGKGAVPLRFSDLKPDAQRSILLMLFPRDFVDAGGWHHVVAYTGREQESLWTLAEWLTGKGTNQELIKKNNPSIREPLTAGQEILFPASMLLEAMRTPTPERQLPPGSDAAHETPPIDLAEAAKSLEFKTRGRKRYAVYRLKPGEALYTAVVVRFTDYSDNADILKACQLIQKESGINDVRNMDPGTEIYVPIDMLADRFKPENSEERRDYEAVLEEAKRLKGQVHSKDLEGVIVILDPGHGGKDHGAQKQNGSHCLYEDELNYDIVCRIKRVLETQTRAKVYVTMIDPDQQYEPMDCDRFVCDEDERVLVTPNYWNGDAKLSANLRWYLANHIYKNEVDAGTDPRKIIFTSIHCDALYNGKLRGAMVYLPGAEHRREQEQPEPAAVYAKYAEAKAQPVARSSAEDRRRDEALSRNFAETLLACLGEARIKRHSVGDPIRSSIRQSGGREYVPAVLRNTLVPTKVLVECANLTNETDYKWLSQPWWRQRFAEAYVEALKQYYA
jgi:N-acetylmuramoyl-L-alanine amidase